MEDAKNDPVTKCCIIVGGCLLFLSPFCIAGSFMGLAPVPGPAKPLWLGALTMLLAVATAGYPLVYGMCLWTGRRKAEQSRRFALLPLFYAIAIGLLFGIGGLLEIVVAP